MPDLTAYVLDGVLLDTRSSAYTTMEPRIEIVSGPHIGDLITLKGARPCCGHWHVKSPYGKLVVGPMGSMYRFLALYPTRDNPDGPAAVAAAYRAAGGSVTEKTLDPNWKPQLMRSEYIRLSNEDELVGMLVLMAYTDHELRLRAMLAGIDLDDLVRLFIESGGDEERIISGLEELKTQADCDDIDDGMPLGILEVIVIPI